MKKTSINRYFVRCIENDQQTINDIQNCHASSFRFWDIVHIIYLKILVSKMSRSDIWLIKFQAVISQNNIYRCCYACQLCHCAVHWLIKTFFTNELRLRFLNKSKSMPSQQSMYSQINLFAQQTSIFQREIWFISNITGQTGNACSRINQQSSLVNNFTFSKTHQRDNIILFKFLVN